MMYFNALNITFSYQCQALVHLEYHYVVVSFISTVLQPCMILLKDFHLQKKTHCLHCPELHL